MFVDTLSRPTTSSNVLAVDLGQGHQCPVMSDDHVVKSLQTSDADLNNHLLFHSNILK